LPKQKTGVKVFKCVSFLFNIVVVLVAVFFGVLTTNSTARNFVFYKIIEKGAAYPNPLDELRCANIKHLSGRVLEIGPGPGTNFRCWQNNTAITEWVGVEPNPFFKEKLAAESLARNVTFPMSTVWLKGENVDVEPGSFDNVVGTHVLCSVDDVYAVMKQVRRALKPGGTYYFTEHVAAEEGTSLHGWQQMFAPVFQVVGNGCKFKTLWRDLTATAALTGFDVNLKRIDAAEYVPFPLIAPHVTGTAVKQQ
jgi:SAM-dependent methyltransferase